MGCIHGGIHEGDVADCDSRHFFWGMVGVLFSPISR